MNKMKKSYYFVIGLLFLFLTGCGSNAELEQLKKENSQLKEQMSIQNSSPTETAQEDTDTPIMTEAPSPEPSTPPTPEPTVKKLTKREKYEKYAKQIKVSVYDKKVLPKDYDIGRYSEFIELDYKVVNKSKKSIKGIKGTLNVYDQFEELIMSIGWDISDGTIGAGKTKKITNYGIDYNQFLDSHNQVYNLRYKDMIFKYEMEQVNFSDGYKLKL